MNLVEKVEKAIQDAENHLSSISVRALGVAGLTGMKVRHLLNNLCADETNYLEIGSYKGATLIAALSGNEKATATAVEGFFEEYSGESGRNYLEPNIIEVLGDGAPIKLLIGDSFTDGVFADVMESGPYDVFMYDGNHGEGETTISIMQYAKAMKDEFILIVDDWCLPQWDKGIRAGTFRAFSSNELEIVKMWEKWSETNIPDDKYSGWWYGLMIAVVRKHG
jgi:hypothetical protein